MTREMTREEVVQRLKFDWFIALGGQLCVDGDKKDGFLEAIGFAIKELQEPERKWIPVSERLPEDTDDEFYPMVLVTLDNGDVCLGVYRHDDKEWWTRMSEGETDYTKEHKVIAWQPLPEPYKAGEQE